MKALEWKTVEERQIEASKRLIKLRKSLKISRERLSILSGVPVPTIRHFENTGNISFHSLVAILVALDCQDDVSNLFDHIVYTNIEDIIKDD